MKFVPVTVTGPPTAIEEGENVVIVGASGRKRNAVALVALCPSEFVTMTSTSPTAVAGVTAVNCVALLRTTEAAATAPNLTAGDKSKFVPVIVTEVPP